MTVYLTIITTALVLTQIIRVCQNHIQLKRQKAEIARLVDEVNDHDIETQKHVYEMLERYLERFDPGTNAGHKEV